MTNIETWVPRAALTLKARMSMQDWRRFCHLHREFLEDRIDFAAFRRQIQRLSARFIGGRGMGGRAKGVGTA